MPSDILVYRVLGVQFQTVTSLVPVPFVFSSNINKKIESDIKDSSMSTASFEDGRKMKKE